MVATYCVPEGAIATSLAAMGQFVAWTLPSRRSVPAIVSIVAFAKGGVWPVTVKLTSLSTRFPLTTTSMRPLVAPAGTLTRKPPGCASPALGVPAKRISFWAGTAWKPVPRRVTVSPGAALVGLKPVRRRVG
ncbi:hypothetical protein D3C86_1813380 [compost metagenome]